MTLLIAVGVVIVVLSTGPGASFDVSIVSVSPAGPSQAKVGITVINTGDKSGIPTCTISLYAPGWTAWGRGSVTGRTDLPVGGEASYTTTVAVANQGAATVLAADSYASC